MQSNFPTYVNLDTRNPITFLIAYPILVAILTFIREKRSQKNPHLFGKFDLGSEAIEKRYITVMREITAVEWSERLADTAVDEMIKALNFRFAVTAIDTCQECADITCIGKSDYCLNTMVGEKKVSGCGDQYYGCDKSHNVITCENRECLKFNAPYRQCVGHTCTFP